MPAAAAAAAGRGAAVQTRTRTKEISDLQAALTYGQRLLLTRSVRGERGVAVANATGAGWHDTVRQQRRSRRKPR